MRKLLFSVTRNDLVRQTFRCPGKGGQNVNKVETGVRFTHRASGAIGHSCDTRYQARNEKIAFERLVQTKEFQTWHRIETAKRLGQQVPESPKEIEARVGQMIAAGLKDGSITIEEFEVETA